MKNVSVPEQPRFCAAFSRVVMRLWIIIALVFAEYSSVCVAQVQAEDARPSFEVASIRKMVPTVAGQGVVHKDCAFSESLFTCQLTLFELIEQAYGLKAMEIVGPRWLNRDVFSVRATMRPGATPEEAWVMLQNLLTDRFSLKSHREMRTLKIYALVTGKTGTTLTPASSPVDRDKDLMPVGIKGNPPIQSMLVTRKGQFYAASMSLDTLATSYLNWCLDRPVVNMTGLKGQYKIDLHWTPTKGQGIYSAQTDPEFARAVEDQLGLRFEKRSLPYNMFLVDSVDRLPSDN